MHVGSLGILTPPLPSSAPAFNTIPGPGVPELPPSRVLSAADLMCLCTGLVGNLGNPLLRDKSLALGISFLL